MSSDTALLMTIRNTVILHCIAITVLDPLIVLLIISPGRGDLLTREQNTIMQEIKGHYAVH